MSQSNRISSILAGLAIVLLIVLLVILWTHINTSESMINLSESQMINTSSSGPSSTTTTSQYKFHHDSLLINHHMTVSTFHSKSFQHDDNHNGSETDTRNDENKLRGNVQNNIEHIHLMKLSHNQYEDPPVAGSSAKRHHSGHFRHVTAEIWDPHPQYEFTAFGKRFLLKLAHDNSFVSQNIKVTHMSKNKTKWEHPGHQLGCYYSGTVDGDPRSIVSVSLCHGMTGHMKTSTGSYIIKPSENWKNDKDNFSTESSLEHVIYQVTSVKSHSNDVNLPDDTNHNCGVIDDYEPRDDTLQVNNESAVKVYEGNSIRKRRSINIKSYHDLLNDDNDFNETKVFGQFIRHDSRIHPYQFKWTRNRYENSRKQYIDRVKDEFISWRPRRALPQEYFIEIMIVADAKMVEYHGAELVGYILVLMSTVSRIYKDPSIGNPISLAVTNIVQINEIFGTKSSDVDGVAAAEMLKAFCYWQKHNNPDEPSPEHHDAALLLTRENLCHNPGQKRCDTLGLAELGKMCLPGSSCAIVQDNGLAAAFTIAHEIGHVFNMPHDDDIKCAKFQDRREVHNVMSRMLDDNTFPWEWSKCSRHHITEFLESEAGYANCLLDEPRDMIRSDVRLPGEDYSENKQCELVFGPGSKICPHMESDVCKRLWCTAPSWNHQPQCHTQHMPWADGTPCSSGKWCQRGECVSKRDLPPIDGQWGEWGSYGQCSRTCGGGIEKKFRECNNPPPQNGGNYCIGERVKYRSCSIDECPSGFIDFREEQCALSNNNNHNIQDLSRDVKWHAKYNEIPAEDRCMLYCQVESNQYYMLHGKVIDGTPCGPDTFHICVNGHCKPAGCDHVLNSTAELDTCGVCRGDNSTCQRIAGSYNSSGIYGYRKIVKIPAGSSYIDIRQHGWGGSHNDSCYLALRLGDDGKYVLNGKFMVMSKKVIVLPGVTIEYSGPGSVVERLNSSRPIGVDLTLEVLSVGDIVPPQITYEYTVPKKILGRYTWILSDWSSCSHMCQGTKQRRSECRSTKHKDVVSDDYCRPEERPQEQIQTCNNHCQLQWQMTSISECSNHCGSGTRMVSNRCVQKLTSSRSIHPLPPHACAHLERPNEIETCIGPCDDAHWSYSEWGSCSVTCGGGMQMRSVTCVDYNNRTVGEDKCSASEKILKRFCGQETCPQWAFGEWTPCSTSCGIGNHLRSYWCQVENRIVSEKYCGELSESIRKVCNAGPCHRWSTGEWSSCSVTCGKGTRRRKVACLNADGSTGNDCVASEKPDNFESCALDPCPTIASIPPVIYSSDPPHGDSGEQENEIDSNGITFHPGYTWRTRTFGKCSQSCNGGFKTRLVQCVSKETHTIVRDDYCDANQRPTSSIMCNQHSCPIWNTGEWSQCDAECGLGLQHRQVRCQSPRGEFLPDKTCSTTAKPKHMKKCFKNPCHTNRNNYHNSKNYHSRKWRVSNWTPCSKSCGGGIKTRRVECSMRTGGTEQPVEDEQCSRLGLVKPRSQRPCQRVPCDYTWREGTWSECTAECGEGSQRRAVSCHRVNRYGWIDPTPVDGCLINEKPKGEQRCKLKECDDKFYWTTGPWRKCSHHCGRKGRQTRRLFCYDRNGKRVGRFNCPKEFKPQRKRKCNQRRCGPLTCLEIQKKFKSTKDGEYIILIGGKNMSIYCHDMATSEPREYLTLPAGDRENYAEIYDKRLRDPTKCPFNGQRNDSCDCIDEPGTISGRTMFKRVRIDVAKLIIIANDYTFSWTKGAKRVEYGKAGDCYSLIDCPQGRFSINLSGTWLKLSTEVSWKPSKSRAHLNINRINDQRILGKCGGYCGFCSPNMDLKLEIFPS